MLDKRLAQIIATTFNTSPEGLTPETGPDALKAWDSVGHLKLILELEAEFGIRFRSTEIPSLLSAGKIQDALQHLKAL